jgi:hypothetical protein
MDAGTLLPSSTYWSRGKAQPHLSLLGLAHSFPGVRFRFPVSGEDAPAHSARARNFPGAAHRRAGVIIEPASQGAAGPACNLQRFNAS